MKNYPEEFKEKFLFLKDYGFSFCIDEEYTKRPCYKNRYGEIILWVDEDKFFGCSPLLYIQINGWKKEIDVVAEYKKVFKKSCFFKPFEIIFKELFEQIVLSNGDFYGLKVDKNEKSVDEEISYDSFEKYYGKFNPFEKIKSAKANLICLISFFSVLFIQIILKGFMIEYVTSYDVYSILKVIVSLLILLNNIFILVLLKRSLSIFTFVNLIVYPIIVILLNYLFSNRIDMIIYLSLFSLNLIILIYYFVKYLMFKRKKELLNGIINSFYPFLVVIVKTFDLQSRLFFNDHQLIKYIVFGFVIGLISVVFYFIFRKDRKVKDYFWGMIAAFIIVFMISFSVPYLTEQNLNYAFDNSKGESYSFVIKNKYRSYSGGRHGGYNYNFDLEFNGKIEKVSVDSLTYHNYETFDTLEFEKHVGCLNIEYYELIDRRKG